MKSEIQISSLIIFSVIVFGFGFPTAFAQIVDSSDDLPVPEQPRTFLDNIFDLPDSPLWGLDVALDNIRLQLASTNSEKARVGLEIAEERLLEIRIMILENKLERADEAKLKHDEVIKEIELKLAERDDIIDTEEKANERLIEKAEIKIRLDEHRTKIKIVADELTDENRNRIISILNEQSLQIFFDNLEGNIEELEIKVDGDETEIRIQLRDEFGKTEIEIEQRLSGIEDQTENRLRIEFESENSDKESFKLKIESMGGSHNPRNDDNNKS